MEKAPGVVRLAVMAGMPMIDFLFLSKALPPLPIAKRLFAEEAR